MKAKTKEPAAKAIQTMPPKTIAAGEFKARCLQLMDEVASTGQHLVVTKRGKPVVEIMPKKVDEAFVSLYGLTKGWMTIHGDILAPLDIEWEADERNI